MALKIVTGGSTGAADGTAVSQGGAFTNPLVIVALNTAVDAHIRCDDGYWSADQDFDVPTGFEVSFDGGSTWYDNADEPITAPEIEDVNYPIKIRQTVEAGSTSGSFVTDGTYTAIAALSTPTLTATPISSTQIDLSWTNVSNEDASPGYTLDRSTAADFSANLVSVTKDANVTTHSATGLTAGTRYYFRVKAEGSGRYSDSAYGTDDDYPLTTTTSFSPSNDGSIRWYDGTGTWASVRAQATGTDLYDTATEISLVASYNTLALIIRGFITFDTSALPDAATIISAKVKVWGLSITGSAGNVILVNGTQGDTLALADYDQNGTTKLSDTEPTVAGWATGAYVEFPLNAAGLAAVSKTGKTKFAFVHSSDYNNSAPSTDNVARTRTVDHATAGNRPVLEVVYAG